MIHHLINLVCSFGRHTRLSDCHFYRFRRFAARRGLPMSPSYYFCFAMILYLICS